jgi:hypothetical protein
MEQLPLDCMGLKVSRAALGATTFGAQAKVRACVAGEGLVVPSALRILEPGTPYQQSVAETIAPEEE